MRASLRRSLGVPARSLLTAGPIVRLGTRGFFPSPLSVVRNSAQCGLTGTRAISRSPYRTTGSPLSQVARDLSSSPAIRKVSAAAASSSAKCNV